MATSENTKRDLLLVIVSMLFIVFILGLIPGDTGDDEPIVIP